MLFTSRAAAESNRGVGSAEDNFCFLAIVSSFDLLEGSVSVDVSVILIYFEILLITFEIYCILKRISIEFL